MDTAIYLVKIGELTLKSGNLKEFEQRLVQNVQLLLEGCHARVQLRAGRMTVEGPVESAKSIEYALDHMIGITGWARTTVVSKDSAEMQQAVLAEAIKARDAGKKTFKVEARRSDKSFPLNSYEIARLMGEIVYDQGILKVDVHHPDVLITVEVRERCYIYGPETTGPPRASVRNGRKGFTAPFRRNRLSRRRLSDDPSRNEN